MPKIHFSIDIGHILTIIAMLIGIGVAYGQIEAKLEEIPSLKASLVELRKSVDQLRIELAGEQIERRSREALQDKRSIEPR